MKETNLPTDDDKEAVPWRWGSWFGIYYESGEFPTQFGSALLTLLNSAKRRYPKTFYGPFREDKSQEVLLRTVTAIVHCKKMREHYPEWNDRQLCAYLKLIIERKIREIRREGKPKWFMMLNRIKCIAKRTLLTIDEKRQIFIPLDWAGSQNSWQLEQDLEARLSNIPCCEEPIPYKIPDSIIDNVIQALFEAAQAPIPLRTLVTHTMRLLQIREPVIKSLETEGPSGSDTTKLVNICGQDIREMLTVSLRPLSPEHLIAVFFRTCKNMTLKETARHFRAVLGLESISLETVRTRFDEAGAVMRGQWPSEPWFPETAEQKEFLQDVLGDCIRTRLRALGIEIEIAN